MRTLVTATATAVVLMVVLAAFATAETPAAGTAPSQVAKATTTPGPESLLGEPYILSWERDARYRGREPFRTVLHPVGGERRKAGKLKLPRTPSEETAFVKKAQSCVEEAAAAVEEADFALAEEKLELAKRMAEVNLSTKSAVEAMATVVAGLAETSIQLDSMRARASLKQALETAAKMQAYFDNDRHGEVVSLFKELSELDDEKGLRNPEVSSTATPLMAAAGELARRAEVHIEFAQMEFDISAVSHFPGGRSFAIVNGEVIGEGGAVAPELALASVDGKRVTFDFKGERVSLDLAE